MPSTTLKATAMPVKTKAFWKVCRKASLSQRFTKFRRPMKWLGRPMKAFGQREVERHHERIGDEQEQEEQGRGHEDRPQDRLAVEPLPARARGDPRAAAWYQNLARLRLAMLLAREDLLHLVLGPGDRRPWSRCR